mmetsp:Transcript_43212/g.101625  ORF Transcript_43212/g.101625 Transcript_43212/m.101625 type:complete len:219 (+) Transcript_43212:65-721(+)
MVEEPPVATALDYEEAHWGSGLAKGALFDIGKPSPTLVMALSQRSYAVSQDSVALVPGCGRAYDALALAEHGFSKVIAIDIAPSAVKAAQVELEAADADIARRVDAQVGDFFTLQGEYDFIWDCTFLCALPPELREQWAATMRRLLKPTGSLLQCVYPIAPEKDPNVGPPYPLTIELCKSLLAAHGMRAVQVEEDLPAEHCHKPARTTGVIEWQLPSQ